MDCGRSGPDAQSRGLTLSSAFPRRLEPDATAPRAYFGLKVLQFLRVKLLPLPSRARRIAAFPGALIR